jgi:type VI secretion system protein ImpA
LLEHLQAGLQQLERITEALQQSQTEPAFNTAQLYEELAFACKALGSRQQPRGHSAQPTAAESSAPAAALGPVKLRREEVQQSLTALIAYFREHEPGHPAPLLLQRVQRMVGASFETILAELYADAEQLVARVEKPLTH